MPFDMIHRQHLKGPGGAPVERASMMLRCAPCASRSVLPRPRPREYSLDVVGSEAHRKLAREAAEKAIVLLKNEGALLPLKGVKKLAVIGKLASVPTLATVLQTPALCDHSTPGGCKKRWMDRQRSSMMMGAIRSGRRRLPAKQMWQS